MTPIAPIAVAALTLLAACNTTSGTNGAPPRAQVVMDNQREIEVQLGPDGTMEDARQAASPFCSPLRGHLSPGRVLNTGNILFRCDPL